MFGLDNLFAQTSAQKFYISRDRIAEILRVSPDALDAFEKAYSKAALQTEPESIFEVNSRQAAAKNERLGDDSPEELKALTEHIVKELIMVCRFIRNIAYLLTVTAMLSSVSLPIGSRRLCSIALVHARTQTVRIRCTIM